MQRTTIWDDSTAAASSRPERDTARSSVLHLLCYASAPPLTAALKRLTPGHRSTAAASSRPERERGLRRATDLSRCRDHDRIVPARRLRRHFVNPITLLARRTTGRECSRHTARQRTSAEAHDLRRQRPSPRRDLEPTCQRKRRRRPSPRRAWTVCKATSREGRRSRPYRGAAVCKALSIESAVPATG